MPFTGNHSSRMYTSYARQSAIFIYCVTVCLCSIKCEVLRQNCSNYQQVYKENLRNCLVNVTDVSFVKEDAGTSMTDNLLYITEKLENIMNRSQLKSRNENSSSIMDTNQQIKYPYLERKWELAITDNIDLIIQPINDTITLQLQNTSTSIEARRKKMRMRDIIPYLIIPGFIMAGVLPWLIPGLKLTVMAVAMVNQMAFTSSLFALIRGYIFDTSKEEHVVYVNHGYNKYKHMKNPHEHS